MRKSIDPAANGHPMLLASFAADDRNGDADAAALREHVTAFAQALAHQDRDFLRLATDRIETGRRIAADLAACDNWNDLRELQAAWAAAKSEACLLEARWLVLYADLIRHPAWLAHQVAASKRAEAHPFEP